MQLSEFIRLFPLRAKKLSWFFGAGSSVSAGMPTASNLIWEFKSKIYCAEEGRQLSLFSNLSDPAVRHQIQSYFDGKGNCPALDSVEEYSFYFEMAYPSASDRREYLNRQLSGMQNSFGHKVIGVLMKNQLMPLIFTTNFDKAFENAAVSELKKTDNWFVGTIDNADTTVKQYLGGFRPMIIKIHGDYFSERLKNTSAELKRQDSHLRSILTQESLNNGVAVMGYSGRDESVIEVFNNALNSDSCFSHGLFWFIRAGSEPIEPVKTLLAKARTKGIQAEFIEIETFDTAWGEIVKGIEGLPKEDMDKLNTNYYRLAKSPLPDKGSKHPIIRFNAIIVNEIPTTARLLKCAAGNTKEIKTIISTSGSNIIALRKANGIVGFGQDTEFEKIFSCYGHMEKDVYHIPEYSLNYEDSSLKGLLTEGLLKAISANGPLVYRKRRERYLLFPNPKLLSQNVFDGLKGVIGNALVGKIPGTNIDWIIAIEISLQKKISTLFMVISPTVIVAKAVDEKDRFTISPFIKEMTARWYNKKYSELLDAWLYIIFADNEEIKISAYTGEISGYNAVYKISNKSGYTRTI